MMKENGPFIRSIIVEFRSGYDKWTVMRMKAKLRECEKYRSVFLEMHLSREERGSKRHSLQAVELSQWFQAAVGPIYRFLGMSAMRTRWMAGAAAHKSGLCRDQSRSDNFKQESLDL